MEIIKPLLELAYLIFLFEAADDIDIKFVQYLQNSSTSKVNTLTALSLLHFFTQDNLKWMGSITQANSHLF